MSYVLLDGIPFYTKEEIDNEFSEGAVGDERARAEAAEQANAAAIEAEVTRATESENALQSQLQDVEGLAEQTSVELGAETIRAKAAENVNAGDIATERSRAIAAEGQIATDIITEAARATAAEQTVQNNVDAINAKIPVAASTQNQLADKAYVEDSIRVADASFRGSYATVSAIPTVYTDYPADSSGNKKPDANDYIYVRDASGYQSETLTGCWKFKYTGDWDIDGIAGWLPEYAISDSVFTQAQVNALNSGADATKIAKIATNESNISDLQSDVSDIEALIPAEATAQNQLADKNSVDTAIAAADKIFYVKYNNSAADKTFLEMATALNAGKYIIVYTRNLDDDITYYGFTKSVRYNSPMMNGVGYLFQRIDQTMNITATVKIGNSAINTLFCTDTDQWYSFNTDIQNKLTAGAGIAINSSNVISTDLFKVNVTGRAVGGNGYTLSPSKSEIKQALRDKKLPYCAESTPAGSSALDGIIFFRYSSSEGGLRVYTFGMDLYEGIVCDTLLPDSGIGSREYYYMMRDISHSSGTHYEELVGLKTVSLRNGGNLNITVDSTIKYGEMTVYSEQGSSITYTDKTGTSKTIVLPAGQIAKFYTNEQINPNCICEHTIPLTGTDDQGNAFAYDVVVRD